MRDASAGDAPIDASTAGPTHAGVLEVTEVRLRNQGGPGVDGHGVSIGIRYVPTASAVPPSLEEQPDGILGCKAWAYTPAQAAALVGVDEGPVQVALMGGALTFPACTFVAGTGYQCIDAASSGTGGRLSTQGTPPGTSLFNPGMVGRFGAEDVGRYLRLQDTGTPGLEGYFPIVGVTGDDAALLAGLRLDVALPTNARFTTVAGLGPVPGQPTSALLANDAQVTFATTMSRDFDPLPANAGLTGAGGIGDAFTLGTADGKVLLSDIPLDGSTFRVGCDSTSACGTATASVLELVTTDAVVTGAFSFPPATTGQRVVRCVSVGDPVITVPAPYADHLRRSNSGATRVRARFLRVNVSTAMSAGGAMNTTTLFAGHAEVGFTTPPAM
ncbi:MAG: hypothetical protein U0325_10865 [Polyangiales bacterium]